MNTQAIRERVERATPGERSVERDLGDGEWIVRTDRQADIGGEYEHDIASFERIEDARQFAYASEDVTEALDLIDTQRARIEELEAGILEWWEARKAASSSDPAEGAAARLYEARARLGALRPKEGEQDD